MIGVIHSIDNPILTILIQECCRVRMERCWLNVTKTPPVGSKVCYETETHDYRLIPRITRIEEYDFDNCSTKWQKVASVNYSHFLPLLATLPL